MKKHIHISLLWGIALVLSACNWGRTNPSVQPLATAVSPLTLVVQVQNPAGPYDSVGDVITYTYTVTNTGTEAIKGPIVITDTGAVVDCPPVKSVGDLNNRLDPGEFLTCTGSHTIIQADLDARRVSNTATASGAEGSVTSSPGGLTVNMVVSTLGLTKTASPLTYSQAGQTITYTYVISNPGTLPIGPVQFTITDDRMGGPAAPIACGPAGNTLNPGGTLTCTGTYTISQQDMTVPSVTNTAIASAGNGQNSSPASATITNSTISGNITPNPSNLTPGTTVNHQVEKGEWLIQIARCYGVTYESLRKANTQITNPSFIEIGDIVTVPNIGSAGRIYGKPCVVLYTVVSGDTWNSIATKYNARVDVLQEANPNGLVSGAVIKVPVNSAGAGAAQVPVTGAATATPTATATATATPTLVNIIPTNTFTFYTSTPGAGQPSRITIPSGTNTASVSGAVNGKATVSYLLNALQGQTMTVTLAASQNDISLRILDPGGFQVKPQDGNLTWTGMAGATGDYRIDLIGLTDINKNYSLTVKVVSP